MRAADFRFVHDIGRLDFQDDRVTSGEVWPCRRSGFVRFAREACRRDGDTVGGEHFRDRDRFEPDILGFAALAQRRVDNRAYGALIRRKILR